MKRRQYIFAALAICAEVLLASCTNMLAELRGNKENQETVSYSVGDVLLDDGTIVRYNAENLSFTEEQKKKAVGVLYGVDEYDKPRGWLGLYNSYGNRGTYCCWAPEGTTGYNTKFSDIVCTPSTTAAFAADTATFTDDTDGSNNWKYICSKDPSGTADAATVAENYPAFSYVNRYGTTFGLTGKYVDGWYMPSLAELCCIYRSKEVLNAVLGAVGGTQLFSSYYWSSSQYGSNRYVAWYVYFVYGDVNGYGKSNDRYVCCVRAFN